jgi:hypothetical protein
MVFHLYKNLWSQFWHWKFYLEVFWMGVCTEFFHFRNLSNSKTFNFNLKMKSNSMYTLHIPQCEKLYNSKSLQQIKRWVYIGASLTTNLKLICYYKFQFAYQLLQKSHLSSLKIMTLNLRIFFHIVKLILIPI